VVGKNTTVVGCYQLRYKYREVCRTWRRCRHVQSPVWAPLFVVAGWRGWGVQLSGMVTGGLVQCEVSGWVTALLCSAYCRSFEPTSLYIDCLSPLLLLAVCDGGS